MDTLLAPARTVPPAATAAAVTSCAARLYPVPATGKNEVVLLAAMQLAEIEALLGGELEVVQLDSLHCLLTNGQARELGIPKNMAASQLWFERHTESGHGADFIFGSAIFCRNAQIAHLNHLAAAPKPLLTREQRAENAANERARLAYNEGAFLPADKAVELEQAAAHEEAKLACSINDPEGCEMCGS